jgi:CubicO group peptidase (beta-lactamase class C family)
LVDEGLIDLDTDISIYLGYEVLNVHHPGTAITARMLMQHNSSIFDSGAFTVSRDRNTSESIRHLLDRGTSFRRNEPGTNFEYSNFGYSILGAICENVSGKSLDTLARDVLFRPLGIDAAYVPENLYNTENIAAIYNETHVVTRSVLSQLGVTESGVLGDDVHLAQGNLTISMLDYARIMTMLGNGGILHGARILSQGAVNEMHITNVEGDGYEQGLGTRFSMGGFITGEGFFWHTGSGYGLLAQYLYSAAETDNRGVVVVTTGAISGREQNGMVSICIELSRLAWDIWDIIDQVPGEDEVVDVDEVDGD